MRTTLRIALFGLLAFVLISSLLFANHHDDWREHLREFKLQPWSHNKTSDHPDETNLGVEQTDKTSGDPEPGQINSDTSNTATDPGQDDADSSRSRPMRKAVVMARLSTENTSWVEELEDWSWFVYTVDDTTAPLHTSENKGRESLAYLTYIAENYDRLADVAAFVHSHRDGYPGGWHTDAPAHSNVASLQMLQTSYIQQAGYANLRCNPSVGCPDELQMHRQPREDTKTTEVAMAASWKELMGDEKPLPDVIGVPCCAQFAVSREQILRRPLTDYQRYKQWVLDTRLDDDISGRVMEYFWHIMFGQEPVFCPPITECYCNVYGQC